MTYDPQNTTVGCVEAHFLDSGSFSLWMRDAEEWRKAQGSSDRWAFYHSQEFWEYVDSYAAFVKKYRVAIDYYANVDVIPNAELSWRNQQYLEKKHGLNPIPVVHYRTPLKWLKHYMDRGHEIIGLGGLVGSTHTTECKLWLDSCFDFICRNPQRLPCVKLHGFGVTRFSMLLRYPWFSVDSTTWALAAGFGALCVPHKRNGRFVFNVPPYKIPTSVESPGRKRRGGHVLSVSPGERAIILEWLEFLGIPIGKNGPNGEVIEEGVSNTPYLRVHANTLFFHHLQRAIPEWPWPFNRTVKRRFEL